MPTEDKHNPDGWTFATLYKHIMEMSAASKEAVAAALEAANKRLDGMNEFRGALKDRETTFADKEGTDRRLKILEDAHQSDAGKSQGVNSVVVAIATGLSILIALGGLAVALLKH
jgi:hypothetical protein